MVFGVSVRDVGGPKEKEDEEHGEFSADEESKAEDGFEEVSPAWDNNATGLSTSSGRT